MKIIDISGALENEMWSYDPPIPKVCIEQVASIDKIGWEAHQISFATISGTYLEASAHLCSDLEEQVKAYRSPPQN